MKKRLNFILLLILTICIFSCVSVQAQKGNVRENSSIENKNQDKQKEDLISQFKDLQQKQEQLQSQYDDLKEIAKFNIEQYHENTLGMIGWLGTLITIVIAVVSILVPILINRNYEKQFDGKIKECKEGIDDLRKMQEDVQKLKDSVQKDKELIMELKNLVEKDKQKAQKSAQKSEAIQYFTEALTETDLNKQIELCSKAIEINPQFTEAYNNRGFAKVRVRTVQTGDR